MGCTIVTVTTPDNPAVTLNDYGLIKCTGALASTCDTSAVPACPALNPDNYYNVTGKFTISGITNESTTKNLTVTFRVVLSTDNGTTSVTIDTTYIVPFKNAVYYGMMASTVVATVFYNQVAATGQIIKIVSAQALSITG